MRENHALLLLGFLMILKLRDQAKRHVVFLYMLQKWLISRAPNPDYKCECRQAPGVERCLHDVWTPYLWELHARDVARGWQYSSEQIRELRSIPSHISCLIVAHEMSHMFDLHRVPGFYFWENLWRINFPYPKGVIKPYHNNTNFIQGFLIYKYAKDPSPVLFNSKGLPHGAKAVLCEEETPVAA
jgi:hypothetical protein